MSTVAFATLKLARRLRGGGFTEAQADVVADALRESFSSGDLATRSDVASLRAEIASVKAEINKWMSGAMLGQGALVVALVDLIPAT